MRDGSSREGKYFSKCLSENEVILRKSGENSESSKCDLGEFRFFNAVDLFFGHIMCQLKI